jgi:hypothetical protein
LAVVSDFLDGFRAQLSSLPTVAAASDSTNASASSTRKRSGTRRSSFVRVRTADTPGGRTKAGIRYRCENAGDEGACPVEDLPRYKVRMKKGRFYCLECAEGVQGEAWPDCPQCGSDGWWFRWNTCEEDCDVVCACGYQGNAMKLGLEKITVWCIASPITRSND